MPPDTSSASNGRDPTIHAGSDTENEDEVFHDARFPPEEETVRCPPAPFHCLHHIKLTH